MQSSVKVGTKVESAMGRFLLVGFLFSAVCACLGRPQEPAAATVAAPVAPVAATTAAPAGSYFLLSWELEKAIKFMLKLGLFGKCERTCANSND